MFIKNGITQIDYKYNEDCMIFATSYKCRSTDEECIQKEELVNTCVDEIRTFNSAGKLEADIEGVAVYKHKYSIECLRRIPNKKLCMALTETLDIEEKPTLYRKERTVVLYDEGCLRVKGELDSCISLREYYGVDGKLEENLSGVARYVYQYDDKGNKILIETYGADGKLKGDYSHIARYVKQYDEKGNKTLEEYYGVDGKLKEDKSGYARSVKQYDKKGNETLEEYYGADEKLKEYKYGYARYVQKYDEKGSKTLEEYYGADGKLKEKDGYARYVVQYNEKGSKALEEYYGADGKLIRMSKKNRDENGYLSSEELLDANGKLIINSNGIAICKYRFDKQGNQLSEEYYDLDRKLFAPEKDFYNLIDGKIFRRQKGIVRYVWQYDETCLKLGNKADECITLIEYYGADEKLKEDQDGYARYVRQYDETCLKLGNKADECITLIEDYGANGKLKDGYFFARYVAKYNEKGNMTFKEYYSADGKLTEIPYGNNDARYVANYNNPCLERRKEHIKKNYECISYEEHYNKEGIIKYAIERIFDSEGNFIEKKEIADLIGVKKWNLFQNTFTFSEKIEKVSESHLIKKDEKFVEETKVLNVITDAWYGLTLSSPHPDFAVGFGYDSSNPSPSGRGRAKRMFIELDKLYRPAGVRFE